MQVATGFLIPQAINHAFVMVILLLTVLVSAVLICFPNVNLVTLAIVSNLEIFILVLRQTLVNISHNISIAICVQETFGTTLTKEGALHAILHSMGV